MSLTRLHAIFSVYALSFYNRIFVTIDSKTERHTSGHENQPCEKCIVTYSCLHYRLFSGNTINLLKPNDIHIYVVPQR